jgi:putative transport protein
MSAPMNLAGELLRHNPEIALLLSLAIGYAAGGLSFRDISLGTTVSTLLAAAIIGQAGITIDPMLKSLLFALFIFTVGYRGGPQFFASLRHSAGPLLAVALVLSGTAIVTTIVVAKVIGLSRGAAGGMMAGALTQSPALGTSIEALARLGLPDDQVKSLTDSAVVAYAVTYLFGEFGMLVFVRNVAPKILGVNLADAAKALEAQYHSDDEMPEGRVLAYRPMTLRAYRVQTAAAGTVAQLESRLGAGALVARLRRGNAMAVVTPDLAFAEGDVVVVAARRAALTATAEALLGPEVDAPELMDVPLQALDIVVTNAAFEGNALRDVARALRSQGIRAVHLQSIHRVQQAVPITPGTPLHIGDVMHVVGEENDVRGVAAALGYADWPSEKSDLTFLGLGIAGGTLFGLLSVSVFGVPLTFGTGGGILIAGLVLGWLRARRPTFGRIPPPAQWIFTDFGLNGFIAAVGLSIGPQALSAIETQGLSLLAAGAILTIVPLLVATLFGKLVLRMNPIILCGALAGAQTNAAVLNAVNDTAGTTLGVLGFTLPFAVNNMILTVAAPIVVSLLS